MIGTAVVGFLTLACFGEVLTANLRKLKKEEEEKKKELEPIEILKKSLAEGKISKEAYLARQKILETKTKKK